MIAAKQLASIVAAFMVVISVGGCTMGDGIPTSQRDLPQVTLGESKEFLRAVDADIFARFPVEQIVRDNRRPNEKNTIMGCSDDLEDPYKDGLYLTDGGSIYFADTVDFQGILDQILEDYNSKEDWTAAWLPRQDELEIKILSPEGYSFYIGVPVSPNEDNELRLSVNGFGPCIPTPPGFNAATDFEY